VVGPTLGPVAADNDDDEENEYNRMKDQGFFGERGKQTNKLMICSLFE
jgi:hypothetical protein